MSAGISTGGVLDGIAGTGRQQSPGESQNGSSGENITDSVGGGLDKNQFLDILMAQLQNQNPLKPQKSGKFVDQMASLTSLEQMTQISDSFESFNQSAKSRQFMTLLGEKVTAKTKNGNSFDGKVESVKFGDDSTTVMISGSEVRTDDITAISTMSDDGSSSENGNS